MGYESRIYVVDKSSLVNNNNKKWGEIIAIYNACKFFELSQVFEQDTDCYIYIEGEEGETTTDKYGKTIKEAPLEKVIDFLEEYQKTADHYRRVAPLIGLLKGFNPADWQNLTVLHYGY